MPDPRYRAHVVRTGAPIEKRYVTENQTGGRFASPQGRVQLNFDDVHVSGVDFSACRFWWFLSKGSLFEDCRFDRAVFQSGFLSSVRQTTYRRCSFTWADLRGIKPGNARFEECEFDQTRVEGWRSLEAEFVECRFSGPLRDVIFFGRPQVIAPSLPSPPRSSNDFIGNDFRDAQFRDVDFRFGIDVERQRLPRDQGLFLIPDAPAALASARRVVAGWSSDSNREEAIRWLRAIDIGLEPGRATIWKPSDLHLSESARAELVKALSSTPAGRARL